MQTVILLQIMVGENINPEYCFYCLGEDSAIYLSLTLQPMLDILSSEVHLNYDKPVSVSMQFA